MESSQPTAISKFVVPITAMLSFISFWRAAAIVLADLGSSAYYAGGIAEQAAGKAAPWFILGIMLLSYAVRAVYIESCSMFVRGGVYRVVRYAMGGVAARFSVSALLFDYVLTGPISGASAGLYLVGLINETGKHYGLLRRQIPPHLFAAAFAIGVTIYFWRSNILGIRFSSQKALRIMQVTAVVVVILLGWSAYTINKQGAQPVPAPTISNLKFSDEALGWLAGTAAPMIPLLAILIGLGHSLLAMSGEESLAQVYREIEAPKLKNLKRAALVIFVFSFVFTTSVAFLAVMIIPDSVRAKYADNLVAGISMFLSGPYAAKLAFHGLVVAVGALILSGAVNTAIIGSNGVINRVVEDGVLPDWFREPHPRNGTTHRIINLIVGLQLTTIVISRGDVYLLGDAYAFGVAWSFAMKALAVLVLRFKEPNAERWKVPLNIRVGRTEIPLGLTAITVVLFALASVNLLTKKTATIWGGAFTLALFTVFSFCERRFRRAEEHKAKLGEEPEMEKFRLEVRENLSPESLQVRPRNILVADHSPNKQQHLQAVLEEVDTRECDIVVACVNCRVERGAEEIRDPKEVVDEHEITVFSKVVYAAEKVGKPVRPVVIVGRDAYELIVRAAWALRSSRVVMDASAKMSVTEQQQRMEAAWERLSLAGALNVEIVLGENREPYYFKLGEERGAA